MAKNSVDEGTYSSGVGLIYVFNLIVGTGALTMPYAFQKAGWMLSLILVTVLGFMGYLTVTFIIESMASANAILRLKEINQIRQASQVNSEAEDYETEEDRPLIQHQEEDQVQENTANYFNILDRLELGKMSAIFFNKLGVVLFYSCIVIYLYGDLAIYAAAVPKTLRDVVCTYEPESGGNITTCNTTITDSTLCWGGSSTIHRGAVYRLFVAAFGVSLGVFAFFNVTKTKILQYFTTAMRWIAFILMIILAVVKIQERKGLGQPKAFDFNGLPNLFGVCVYSFMCHHAIPSLVTPIKNKSKLLTLFAADYSMIFVFYCILSLTAVFAFRTIDDLYTLNFNPRYCGDPDNSGTSIAVFQYFLTLFPVFTLSTNFPIISISLRNNLRTLTEYVLSRDNFSWFTNRIMFPLVTVVPPILVALVTNDLEFLVGITGSYAGVGIQYLIPAFLVYYSRKKTAYCLGAAVQNKHSSPFKHAVWVYMVFIWALACIVFVTVNHIIKRQ